MHMTVVPTHWPGGCPVAYEKFPVVSVKKRAKKDKCTEILMTLTQFKSLSSQQIMSSLYFQGGKHFLL